MSGGRARARASARRNRRAWQIAIFVTLPGVVLGTGTVAGAYGLGIVGKSEVQCAPIVVRAPARSSFDVRVFNASGVDRVAAQAAKELGKRGFKITETSGVPEGHLQSGVEIAHGRAGLDGALLLAKQLPDVRLANDGRKGTSVSFVIGGDFTGLTTVPPPPPPRATQVRVNVYNATYRSGLAAQVATELGTRGFREGKSGNDPQSSFLPEDSAVIRYGEDAQAEAKLLAEHVPGAVLTNVTRADKTLDLVLGNHYEALTPAAQISVPPVEKPAPPETVARPCTN